MEGSTVGHSLSLCEVLVLGDFVAIQYNMGYISIDTTHTIMSRYIELQG